MTRVFLSGLGMGITSTLVYAAFWGQQSCVSLSFVSGIAFTCAVLLVAGLVVWWMGRHFGWIDVFHVEHSQPLDGPEDTSPY